jgi:phage/plasmid-associated DNA primase
MSIETPTIFASTAPAYFAAGMSVIPLHVREKKPVPNDWSMFHDLLPAKELQNQWLAGNPNSNIGLVLGRQSGVTMIDIDTDDEKIYSAIMGCLPHSPWHRRGKKGMMIAFKFSGHKTFRIKNMSGQTMVECLSSRTQCVLPPSIHPETQQPYTSNCELIDVVGNLHNLPTDIEDMLRTAIKAAGVDLSHSGWSRVTDYVSSGSRDTTLTEMAGLFAFAVVRGERTLKEAIGMLQAYYNEYIETVAGDQIDVEKHIENLIKFLHRDVLDKGKVLPKGWDEGYSAEDLTKMGVTLGVDQTEWAFDEVRNYLKTCFETYGAEGKERGDAVEIVLSRIAKSKTLSKIDEDRLLQYIVDVSGLGVKISTLRARLKELRAGTVQGNDHSEIARAVLADLSQYNLVRFHTGKLMKWAGSHWVEMEMHAIKSLVSNSYGHLAACKKASDINGILQILMYIAEQGIQKKVVKGINFANGFLTQELKLIPHEPDFGMTYTMPFRYVPEEAGRFPMFDAFLARSWGADKDYIDKVMALQEAMAVTLFGLGSMFQRAILLHGAPKSGKTQLLRIIETLVPAEARTSVPPNHWDDKYMPGQMVGKILNICGELSDKKLIDGQSFKDIVDGSERSGQHKYGAIFSFRPLLTHWFASNHIPRTADTSSGFIRRWLFLTFHFPVQDGAIVADIGDIIAAQEREAIVSWAAQAMPRLLKKGDYTTPDSHRMLVNEFANMNNSVRYYMRESGKITFDHAGHAASKLFATEMSLYNSYWAFCAGAGGLKPVGQQRFRAIMRELQPELGFKLEVAQTTLGGTEAVYRGMSIHV